MRRPPISPMPHAAAPGGVGHREGVADLVQPEHHGAAARPHQAACPVVEGAEGEDPRVGLERRAPLGEGVVRGEQGIEGVRAAQHLEDRVLVVGSQGHHRRVAVAEEHQLDVAGERVDVREPDVEAGPGADDPVVARVVARDALVEALRLRDARRRQPRGDGRAAPARVDGDVGRHDGAVGELQAAYDGDRGVRVEHQPGRAPVHPGGGRGRHGRREDPVERVAADLQDGQVLVAELPPVVQRGRDQCRQRHLVGAGVDHRLVHVR